MILINDTVISEDVADEFFVCDLAKCKGACCVQGDAGAPLLHEELNVIENVYSLFIQKNSSEKNVYVFNQYHLPLAFSWFKLRRNKSFLRI